MSKRYAANTLALVAAAFLAVVTQSFGYFGIEWIGFGVSAGIAALGLLGLAFSRKPQHFAGFGVLTAAAAWSVVASLVFGGATLLWLTLADAVGMGLIALGSLVIHEFTTERVVHTLEVRQTEPAREPAYAA